MSAEELNIIRTGLKEFFGSIKEIQRRSADIHPSNKEFSYAYILLVLNGKRNNEEIIALAADVLREHRERKKNLALQLQTAMRDLRELEIA